MSSVVKFLLELLWCRKLGRVPTATKCFDQLNTGSHLLRLQIHRRTLIVQERRLRGDHVQITINPRLVTLHRKRQCALRRRDGLILLLQLTRQNPQRRKVIFNLLERRQHCISIACSRCIILRARELRFRLAPSFIKERLTQRWPK